MALLALKKMKLSGGRVALPGDPVPEAAEWRNLESYVKMGSIGFVDDAKADEVSKAIKEGKPIAPGMMPFNNWRHKYLAPRQAKAKANSAKTSAKSKGAKEAKGSSSSQPEEPVAAEPKPKPRRRRKPAAEREA